MIRNQNLILSEGKNFKRAHVAWTLVRQGGSDVPSRSPSMMILNGQRGMTSWCTTNVLGV